MFEIKKIMLWSSANHKEISLNRNTYVIGKNSVGKTALVKVIDHVLGDHSELYYAGLDNLTEVGALLINDKTELWVKRSTRSNGGFYYKRTEHSDYSEVSGTTYRDIIQNIIHRKIDSYRIGVYRKVFEEDPSFRSFAFMNFIDETNQGNLFSIFTRGREIKNAVRIQNVMQFFFNYKNIEELYEKTVELETAELELTRAREAANRYNQYRNTILKLFTKLQLDFQDDYATDYQTFLDFYETFSRKRTVKSADLVYLTRASFELSEEIKKYHFMHDQTLKAAERKKRDLQLLDGLTTILKCNPDFKKYIDSIVRLMSQLEEEGVILTLSDYDGSIADIEAHKRRLDEEIKKIQSQAKDLRYDQVVKDFALLEDAFKRIDQNIDVNEQGRLEERISRLKREIKQLKTRTNEDELMSFNDRLTKTYLDKDLEEVNFIAEDLDRSGFYLEFVPAKQQITVWHNENAISKDGVEKNIKISFDPGSLARHTYIQILFYIRLLGFLNEEFSEMPIMPILVIDSADQTIQNEYFEKIYPKLVNYAHEIGIQLIFLSKECPCTVDPEEVIDLTEGLNPYHKG